MPEAHDLPGGFYVHLQRYPDLRDWAMPVRMPLLTESASTQEIEPPYRLGRGRVFRAWPTRWALVVGRWSPGDDAETPALQRAADGRVMDVRLAEIRQWPGTAPEDAEGVFADTPGVITWAEPEEAR